jgi:hypothetical protein
MADERLGRGGYWNEYEGKKIPGVPMYFLTVLLSVREVSGLNLGNHDCGISRGSRPTLEEVTTADFRILLSASPIDPSSNAT